MKLCIYLQDEIGERLNQESQVRNLPVSKIVAEALTSYLKIEVEDKESDYETAVKEVAEELDDYIIRNPGNSFTMNCLESFKNLNPNIKASVGRKISGIIRTKYQGKVELLFNKDGSVAKNKNNATWYFINR